jgi:hypothetical protein
VPLERRQPVVDDGVAELGAAAPAASGMLTMFGAGLSTPEYGYSGYWNVDTISTRGSSENICLGAVAVVDVEIDDRDARQAVGGHRMRGADGDVVEHAEAHRAGALRVMAGRSNGERRLPLAAADESRPR